MVLHVPQGNVRLDFPDTDDAICVLVAGTGAAPQVLDLYDLPEGARVVVTTYLGDQVLQDRVFTGTRKFA